MDHLSEIEDRLMRAVVVICDLGKQSGSALDRERLLGKAEGVKLALDWVREQMKLQAASA